MNDTMTGLILRRIGTSLLILLGMTIIVFSATLFLPGDVVEETLGQAATPDVVAAVRKSMGLDRPPVERYVAWLWSLVRGDPGISLVNQLPVAQQIGQRLPNSLMLAGCTAALAVPLALFIGTTSAMRQGSRYDRLVSSVTVSMVSVPEFLVASIAVLVLAVNLRLLPALSTISPGMTLDQLARALAMPVVTLTLIVVAQMARLTRAALVNTLRAPYIEMAVLKGAGPARVVLLHALPNAIGPIANAIALSLSSLIGGVVVIESIFNYPGLASLMLNAVANRDIPIVLACAMIFSTSYLLLVTIADVLAIASNPRLRQS
jgi:peptide/nickel transport system permease protein